MTNNVSALLRRGFALEEGHSARIKNLRRIDANCLSLTVDLATSQVYLCAYGEEEYFQVPIDNPGIKLLTREFKSMAQIAKPGHRARLEANDRRAHGKPPSGRID